MEIDKEQKIGSIGDAKVHADIKGESAQADVLVGPIKLSLSAQIDNRALLDLVASKVPGGLAHDAVIALEKLLFPDQPSA